MVREYMAEWFRMLLVWIKNKIHPAPYQVVLAKTQRPLDWLGADDAWADACERMRDPIDLTKDPVDQQIAIIWQRQRNESRTVRERMRHDVLGSWDPDAVDWQEPALFQEAALDALRSGMFRGVVRDDPELVDHAMDLVLAAS